MAKLLNKKCDCGVEYDQTGAFSWKCPKCGVTIGERKK